MQKVKLSLCLTNRALRHEGVWGCSGCIDPNFLNLGTIGGEWSASHPCRFTLGGNSPLYPLYKRLVGPQCRFGRCGEEKILDSTGTRTLIPRLSSP
jgi:hypothetical protein